jgi:hypothetical protein
MMGLLVALALLFAGPEESLPRGVYVRVKIDAAFDGKARVGDMITATVTHNVVVPGTQVVSKGAKLRGRLTRMNRSVSVDTSGLWYEVGIMFDQIEQDGNVVRFAGTLEEAGSLFNPCIVPFSRQIQVGKEHAAWLRAGINTLRPRRGEGVLLTQESPPLPEGLPMTWRAE